MNGILVALRDFPDIEFIHVRHEEAGVFAANAEAFEEATVAARTDSLTGLLNRRGFAAFSSEMKVVVSEL